jgi:signal transduction histidine kinase/CheY-like chemotaxis protein
MNAAIFAVAYLLLALFSVSLPRFEPLHAWPAHGLALGVLLLLPRAEWPLYLALALGGTLIAGAVADIPSPALAMTASVAIMLPALTAAGMLRLAGPSVQVDNIRGLAAFLVGMVATVIGVALLEAGYAYLIHDVPLKAHWTIAFVSAMLGMLLLSPLILAWSRQGLISALSEGRARLPEIVALYVGLAFTTYYIFAAAPEASFITPPLLYLCAPFLIWAALRFGLRSSTLGLAIFGLLSYWFTGHGMGPFAIAAPGDTALLHLHAYLATIIVTTLFSAALLVERREAERETEEWRFRHERVIRASQSLLYEFDPVSGTIVWDGETRRVIGADPGAVATARAWMARVHPDDRVRLRGLRKQLISGEISHIAMEYRFRRDDDDYATVGVNAYLIGDPSSERGGRRVVGFVKDVSDKVRADEERRRLEAQLKQAEKMQAVGHLAGGIAHDFNNILGAILGYGELAQRKADGDQRRYLDTIMDAGNRGKALVNQILSYSRAEGSEKVPVIVAAVAQEACDLVRGSSPKAIEVDFSTTSNDAAVMGDPTRMHQLLMNLSTNAIHAMEDGGRLEVKVESERFDAPRKVRSGEVPPGDYVRITVADTGHGIAPEVIDRIFEPFFTTKPAGRGTGLGLALVHSVVTEHQGYIDVASELGRGTAFTVWIPRVEGAYAGEAQAPEMPMGSGQSVLVVDDEPEVLAALEEMLASLGYEPVGFRDSREALEAARADPRRFEAVVSDEVMPQLTGTQLAVELRKLNPTLPILIASGYGGAGFETRALSAGVNRVIKKPYRMSEIAEILDSFFAGPA